MDLPLAVRPDEGHGLTRLDGQVEAVEHLRGVLGGPVGEVDAAELDAAPGVDQVDGAGAVLDGRDLVEDLVDPPGRSGRPLGHHQEEAEHPERGLEHDDVGVEGDQGPDLDLAVDGQPPAVGQHGGQADPGQVLHERGVGGPGVGLAHVGPAQALGGPGQPGDLALLGGEGLHDADAVDVLVDDGGHVGLAGGDDPREREDEVPQLRPDDVHARAGRPRRPTSGRRGSRP